MLLCTIPPSVLFCDAVADGGGGAGAIAAVFAFLTDLYLEYFAGACTAAAGALSVIVAMAGFCGYFFDFVRRLRKIVLRAQCIAGPLYVWYFVLYNYRGIRREDACVVKRGVGRTKCLER